MGKVYAHAVLKVRIGRYDEFCVAMAKQVVILEGLGWKLVGAWTSAVGQICTVVDLWELEDANAYFDVTAKWRSDPSFLEFRAVTKEVLIEETISLMLKAPYSS